MSLFSSIGKLFKSLFSKLMKLIKKIFKAIWPILLIIAIIYFAPAALAFLTSAGAPAFLTSAFSWISTTLTPTLMSGLSWLTSTGGSLLSSGWTAFKGLETGTQLAIVGGAAAAIAPEEVADVLEEAGSVVGDLVTGVVGAVGSVLFSSPWVIAAAGVGLYFLLRKKSTTAEVKLERVLA